MSKVRIVAAVVDTTQLILYKEDGSTIEIPQGDERVRPIIEEISPKIAQGLVAEIDFQSENHYHEFEKKSSGLVKMFRIAKKKVAHIFGKDIVESQTIGNPNKMKAPDLSKGAKTWVPEEKVETNIPSTKAIDDIMAHAKPVEKETFTPKDKHEEDTVIAVVENSKGEKKIIPGMENLKGQFANAAKLGSTIGVERFLKRLGDVIDKRSHSVEDLLRFMERGDLPIADDGSIVAYKVLTTMGKHTDIFYDCHTKKVQQKVGSHVFMKESMVDHNRNNECSNGLHIARRGYLSGFSGDVIVICKINPEDVIAVPSYDSNKVRVCGYHILGKIPASEHANLRSNKPMTENSEAAKLLGSVLRGDHIGIIEEVEIGGSLGGNLRITPLVKSEAAASEAVKESIKTAEKAEPVKALEDIVERKLDAPVVDPKAVSQKVAQTKAATPRDMFNNKEWDNLLAHKKKKKTTWAKLGFNPSEIKTIEDAINAINVIDKGKSVSASEMKKKEAPKKEPLKKQPVAKAKTVSVKAEVKAKPECKPEPKTVAKPVAKVVSEKKKETKPVENEKTPETREQKARRYFDLATKGNKSEWTSLWLLKKQAKKSWEQLGFTKKEEERIITNKPDHV